ncbi:MAG: Gfo/Idh/MocA family protein, partial [Myxococcota bacterium]
ANAPRVGILGGRRVRQGLGPFVARDLVAAGAEVPCFSVTSARGIAPALAQIERFANVSPRGYADVDQMLDEHALDAVAILSPAETHEEHLRRAVRRGLAVLCEKPLVWGTPSLAATASELVAAFAERDLLLYENCQWPCALPAFERLHPGALAAPPRRFAMELQPASRGLGALGDSLSHPLSVLQVLVPGDAPAVEAFRAEPHEGSEPRLTLQFRYRSGGRSCDVAVVLWHSDAVPRRAALEIDGRPASRVVAPQTYQLSFCTAGRTVPIDDPLTILVADFVARLRAPDAADRRARARDIEVRMQLLAELASAYLQQVSRSEPKASEVHEE